MTELCEFMYSDATFMKRQSAKKLSVHVILVGTSFFILVHNYGSSITDHLMLSHLQVILS